MVGFSPMVLIFPYSRKPFYYWKFSLIWLTKGFSPFHDLLFLERASRCGLNLQSEHIQEATYPCFSLIPKPLPGSQINRLYPVCIVLFQNSNYPDGVGKEGKSSAAILLHGAVQEGACIASLQ